MRFGFVIFAALLAPLSAMADNGAQRREVEACWDARSVSTDTSQSVVSLLAYFRQDGSVKSVEMLSVKAPSDASGRAAYELARRAVFRCAGQAGGSAEQVIFIFDYRNQTVTNSMVSDESAPIDI